MDRARGGGGGGDPFNDDNGRGPRPRASLSGNGKPNGNSNGNPNGGTAAVPVYSAPPRPLLTTQLPPHGGGGYDAARPGRGNNRHPRPSYDAYTVPHQQLSAALAIDDGSGGFYDPGGEGGGGRGKGGEGVGGVSDSDSAGAVVRGGGRGGRNDAPAPRVDVVSSSGRRFDGALPSRIVVGGATQGGAGGGVAPRTDAGPSGGRFEGASLSRVVGGASRGGGGFASAPRLDAGPSGGRFEDVPTSGIDRASRGGRGRGWGRARNGHRPVVGWAF